MTPALPWLASGVGAGVPAWGRSCGWGLGEGRQFSSLSFSHFLLTGGVKHFLAFWVCLSVVL